MIADYEQAVLEAQVLKALQETLYSNRMRVAPRRIKELAQGEAGQVMQFLETQDQESVFTHGQHLAREGLGQKAVVRIASAIRLAGFSAAQSECGKDADMLEAYTNALLDGYMVTYEDTLRVEQQRTHEAFVRSLNGN